MGVHSFNSPAFLFVCILMHGSEEWVLVQLGSQHKHAERPAQSMFSDFLSVSCDHGQINLIKFVESNKFDNAYSKI